MRRRRVLSYALLAFATTAAAGGYAAHRLLDRPGETALALVPADAIGVVALDLVPAPDQVLAFKTIDDVIAKAPDTEPGKALIGTLLKEFAGVPELSPLTDQVDRSIALAGLPKPGKAPDDAEGVVLMPIKDPAAVAAFLATKGQKETVNGTALVRIKTKTKGDLHFWLQGSTLVGAEQAWAVASVAKVGQGQAPSLAADPAFAAARAKALPSANLLVLASPELAKGSDWSVASMTIRDTGVEVAMSGQTDDPDVRKIGSLEPLDAGVLTALPRGAYGFFASAQPGPAMLVAGKELDESAAEMKKEIDIDLKEDVVPALSGNALVALYPSYGPDAGLDLLYVIDDANGADPARLARKLERVLGEKLDEAEPGTKDKWIEPLPTPGMEGGRLGDEPAMEMEKAMRGLEKSYFRPLTLSRGKTVAWAYVGKSVVFATSKNLLDRAVALRKAPSDDLSLASDPALGANPRAAADGQFALAISMKRLAEGIRNTVDPSHMSLETAKIYRKSLGLFDNVTEPLAIRANLGAGGRYQAYVSIPFDWSKIKELGI